MKKYIFYSTDGETKDKNLQDIENCQILGWASGINEQDAFNNLKKENRNIDFENICCQELVSDKVYYF